MRIDLFNTAASQIASDSNSKKVSADSTSSTQSFDAGAHATLSSDATSVSSLVSQALNSPEVRQDKVDSLKQQVSSGQYQLDPSKIAGSIVGED
jgi:negative regulator of flagellin synthesis FlgM